MTLAELRAFVGESAGPGETRRHGELVETWWSGRLEQGGWWWAVSATADGQLLGMGWTSGNRRELGAELTRAAAALQPFAGEEAI